MLVFVDTSFIAHNIDVFRCTSCTMQFELKFVDKGQTNPNYCPKCGTPALLKKVR